VETNIGILTRKHLGHGGLWRKKKKGPRYPTWFQWETLFAKKISSNQKHNRTLITLGGKEIKQSSQVRCLNGRGRYTLTGLSGTEGISLNFSISGVFRYSEKNCPPQRASHRGSTGRRPRPEVSKTSEAGGGEKFGELDKEGNASRRAEKTKSKEKKTGGDGRKKKKKTCTKRTTHQGGDLLHGGGRKLFFGKRKNILRGEGNQIQGDLGEGDGFKTAQGRTP